jgi:hypothetical protein
MKKILSLLLVLCALAISSHAATLTISNFVTYASSGGASTNYGTPVLIGSATVPLPPTINFSHGGLSTTNSAVVTVQIGTSSASNLMSTVTTYYPTVTNATDEVIAASTITLPIYMQTIVVTTNSASVGTKAVFVSP